MGKCQFSMFLCFMLIIIEPHRLVYLEVVALVAFAVSTEDAPLPFPETQRKDSVKLMSGVLLLIWDPKQV